MRRYAAVFVIFVALFSGTVLGQHAVDPGMRYHRLICLVHLTGAGTPGDPIRPEYVPGDGDSSQADRTGIIAWAFQITDDRQMAIVHLVAVDRRAFAAVLADTRPEIRVFEIGKQDRSAIETEMRKYRQDFNLDSLQALAQ